MTTAHEPRGGPGTHLSAEDLSALAEGVQPSAQGAAEHLVECAACRGEVDAMSELLARFAEWDAPAMPREVAIRIDAALARESAARGTSPGISSPESTSRPRRRRWRPAAGLSWSVAALVLIAGGFGLILKLSSSSGDSTTASASSGSGSTQPLVERRSPEANGPNADSRAGPPSSSVRAPNSLLAVWTTQALASRRTGVMLDPSCLADPKFAGSHELATANGTYGGRVAMLIVYPNPQNPATVLAVVYASPCDSATFDVLDTGLVAKPAVTATP